MQHSSGTTGLKKGVALSHRAIDRQISAYARAIALGQDDSIASWLPLYHDMGLIAGFLTSLVRHVPLIAIDPFVWAAKPGVLLDAIERYGATLCWMPNFAFAHLVRAVPRSRRWDLSAVRAFINCSEPCRPATFDRFLERFADCGITSEKLATCYAMAENVFAAAQSLPGATPARRTLGRMDVVSSGRAIESVQIRICDADGAVLDDGLEGEIALKSPFLFDGYHQLPERTAQVLREGWFHTGDLGLLADGELYVTGRTDDVLSINGRNIHAYEIEEIAGAVAGCIPGRCVAFTVRDPSSGINETVLVVESDRIEDAQDTRDAIVEAIEQHLALTLARVSIAARGRLVKTTSGKISRIENQRLFESGAL